MLATRLVLLRSRLLLPANHEEGSAAEEEAREVRTLSDRLEFRSAAGWLGNRPQLGIDTFAPSDAKGPREGGYLALMEACLAVLQANAGKPEDAPLYRPTIPAIWRAGEALALIRSRIAAWPEGGALPAFLPEIPAGDGQDFRARAAVSASMLAGLELAKAGELAMNQEEDWNDIALARLPTQ